MNIPPPSDPTLRFNPPPGWDAPYGFDPRKGHLLDPAWPPPPPGWELWVRPPRSEHRDNVLTRVGAPRLVGGLLIAGLAVLLIFHSVDSSTTPTGVGSCWAAGTGAGDQFEAVRCDSDRAEYTVDSEVADPSQCPVTSAMYFETGGVVQCLSKAG